MKTRIESAVQPEPTTCPKCGIPRVYFQSRRTRLDNGNLIWNLLDCPQCGPDKKEKAQAEHEMRMISEAALMRRIPKMYQEATLENLTGFDALIKAYREKDDGLLLISGPAGIGKTYALYALYRLAHKESRACGYTDLREFLFNLKARVGIDYPGAMEAVIKLANYEGMILLDDLGAESATKMTQDVVETILTTREKWRNGLTVITSNLSLKEIGSLFDDSIASRLSGGTVIKITGEDRRLGSG